MKPSIEEALVESGCICPLQKEKKMLRLKQLKVPLLISRRIQVQHTAYTLLGDSQPLAVTPAREDPMPLSGLCEYQTSHTYKSM